MLQRRRLLAGGSVAALVAGIGSLYRGTARADGASAFEVHRTDEEWRRSLEPAQYQILRRHGTEAPGSSPLDHEFRKGLYICAGCAAPLYSSENKFDSGTGWPSFWKPLDNSVDTSTDDSFLMMRTEIHCRHCGGHLGHVFNDGPAPTGLRYCMNGAALIFQAA